jgi:hypothetical protein
LFISDYNVKPSNICGTNVAEFSLYSLFGDGEGRGYTVCTSVDLCQSKQWNSAAQMLQNFHYIPYLGMEKGGGILFISDYNVKPSKICSKNVAEFSLYSLFGDGEGRGYTICTSVDICQSNQWNSAARMSRNFHHTLYISDYKVSPMVICCRIVTEFSLF